MSAPRSGFTTPPIERPRAVKATRGVAVVTLAVPPVVDPGVAALETGAVPLATGAAVLSAPLKPFELELPPQAVKAIPIAARAMGARASTWDPSSQRISHRKGVAKRECALAQGFPRFMSADGRRASTNGCRRCKES
jgi:hypothetical protein